MRPLRRLRLLTGLVLLPLATTGCVVADVGPPVAYYGRPYYGPPPPRAYYPPPPRYYGYGYGYARPYRYGYRY